jgi:hypothetical protein
MSQAYKDQQFSFTKLIGQGVKIVTVWYDYDDDTNTINDMVVCTEDGVEIDQYLTTDQLNDLDMDCYEHQRNQGQSDYYKLLFNKTFPEFPSLRKAA